MRANEPAHRSAIGRGAVALLLLAAPVSATACGRRAPASALVKGLTEIEHVHLGTDHVYWRGHAAVLRASKAGDGSDTRSIFQADISDFAVNTVAIYFTSERSGVVASVPLAGGIQTTIANKLEKPNRMAQDFVFLYVCNHDASGSIVKVPKAGGAVKTLAEKQSEPQALAVDSASVFFGTNNGQLMKVSKGGGDVSRLDAETAEVTDVAVDDDAVYWSLEFAPTVKILRIGKGGENRTILAKFEGHAPRIALSGAFVYVSAEVEGKVEISKLRADGKGKLERIGTGRGESVDLALDSTHVFAGVRNPKGDDGSILKLPR